MKHVYQWNDLLLLGGLALIYALLASLVLTLTTANGNVTIFWIPGGVGLAALLIGGKKLWPGIFTGAILAGLIVENSLGVSFFLALGNTLESLFAAWFLQCRKNFSNDLTGPHDFLLLALAAAFGSSVSALLGPLTLLLSGYLTQQTIVSNMMHWWQGDTLGILLGTPIVLVWRQWPYYWFKRQRILTTFVFFFLAFLAGQIIFLQWFHESLGLFARGYWVLLFVVLAAVNYGRHGALVIIAMTAIQALLGAQLGIGYFGQDIAQTGLQNFWFYLLVLTIVGISLAVSIGQRELAEQALRESEAHLKAFFDNSPIGIKVFDLNGKALIVNRAARHMFGISLNDPLENYGLFEDPAILPETKQVLRQGQIAQEERFIDFMQIQQHGMYTSTRNPSDRIFISLTFSPCFTESEQLAGYIASIIDITERKFDEAQIHQLNSVYAVLAHTNRVARHAKNQSELFDAVCRIAVEEGGMKMAWLGMSQPGSDRIEPVACYGANVDYLDGIDISINPNIPEGQGPTGTAFREGREVLLQDFIESPLTEPWAIRAQNTGKWHSSAAFPILRDGHSYAVLTIYHAEKNAFNELMVSLLNAMVADIGFTLDALDAAEQREKVLEKLRLSEESFRTLNDLLPDQIWTARPDGRLDYVNQRVLEYFGCSLEEMLEDGWQAIVHPEDLPSTLNIWSESLRTGHGYEVEFRLRHHSGEYRWCLARALPAFDGYGHIIKWYGINTDIMERKQSEERQRLTARVFDTTLEGIMITDAQCNLIDVNEAFTLITGYTREEVKGKNPRLLKSDHQDAEFYRAMWRTINSTGHWSGEIWNRRKNGEVYPEWITISAITDDKGVISHYVGISSDITLLKQHEKQLEHIAHYDALTGIPNRVLLVDRMKQALAQTRREQKLMAICYLDLDGFKPINDTMGHDAGDKVLIEIAKRISHSLRGGDTVARLGGDEFVILLLDIENKGECNNSLDRLLSVIAQTIVIQGKPFTVTASIGVTLYPVDHEEPDTLLRHADQAMYQAKQLGKNRYHIFDPDEGIRLRIQNEQKAFVEQGFQNQQFVLYYQPKVALDDHRIVGVEALIRWRHPERGLLSPNDFLPMIENTDLDVQVGEWVIGTALKQMELWHQAGLDLEVSVNVSANHLQSPDFVSKLQQKLALSSDLPPQHLQIEIVETAALHDIPAVSEIIRACESIGVSFALDDFGTGYSSLAYLRRLSANTLKIDQSFVRDMLIDEDDRSIVQGVIALADTFNRITVAEGVETQEHYDALRALGCDIGQGYGIARPMPAHEIPSWCQNFNMPAANPLNLTANLK
ncbi:MAG: EAL domain-containing protein [Gammaproteobacteria bacterium]